jgi:hypothetical protein
MVNIGIALAGGSVIGGVVIMLALWAYDEYQRNQRRHAYVDRPQPQPQHSHSRTSCPPQPSNECTICQDSLSPPLEILPCDHLFHRQCIKRWFKQRMVCPVCRARINEQQAEQYIRRLGL